MQFVFKTIFKLSFFLKNRIENVNQSQRGYMCRSLTPNFGEQILNVLVSLSELYCLTSSPIILCDHLQKQYRLLRTAYSTLWYRNILVNLFRCYQKMKRCPLSPNIILCLRFKFSDITQYPVYLGRIVPKTPFYFFYSTRRDIKQLVHKFTITTT